MIRVTARASLICLLFAPLVQGSPGPEPAGAGAPLDEVVVESARAKLNEIRGEMIRLEDRFYERYSQLNPNDEFDVSCDQETRAGTRLKFRYCRATFERDALATEGLEYVQFLQRNSVTLPLPTALESPVVGGPPSPAIMAIMELQAQFRKNLLEVSSRNPELVELLRERYELGSHYDATRRAVFGRGPGAAD